MLQSIYFDDGLKLASKIIGNMGAPVESQFESHSGPELWEDEVIVRSRDPLATGLLAMNSVSAPITENGQGPAPLDSEVMLSNRGV